MKNNSKLLNEELNKSKYLMGLIESNGSEKQLGKKIEKEHDPTYNKIKKYYEKHKDFPGKEQFFEWIVDDHLDEFKDYYTRLEKMEKDAKSDKKKINESTDEKIQPKDFKGALANLDSLIKSYEEKIELLKKHKKGLIQKFSNKQK